MKKRSGLRQGFYAAGVKAAINAIVKDLGLLENFPREGTPEYGPAMRVIEKRTEGMEAKSMKFVTEQIVENWVGCSSAWDNPGGAGEKNSAAMTAAASAVIHWNRG